MAQYTSLEALKLYIGKPDTGAHDVVLADLLEAVERAIDGWLGRSMMATDYDETYDGMGGGKIIMRNWPVLSVESVTVNGQPLQPQDAYGRCGYRAENWLLLAEGGARFSRGTRNVRVKYRAGFETPPADIAQAIHQIVATRFKERDWTGYASKSLAGEVISFHSYGVQGGHSLSNGGIPPAALGVLNNYKRVVPA